jgi:glycosyltransferase involved in cell wall biosynthesis
MRAKAFRSSSMKMSVTVIVLTFNESVNIADCLKSVAWADDVVIVDSGSTDDTVALARRVRPDVRCFEHLFQDFGDQRNWALDNTEPKHDWILFLDADERITSALSEAMSAVVMPEGDKEKHAKNIEEGMHVCTDRRVNADPGTEPIPSHAGYYLCNRYFFMGRWIKHCALYPSWQLRLLRKGQVRFRKEGHGQREVTEGSLGYLEEPYDHYGFSKGIEAWVARHDAYASNEVELIRRLRSEPLELKRLFSADPIARRRCLKSLAVHLPCRPLFRFLYMYIIRFGFLDGRPGWVFCRLRFSHEMNIAEKLGDSRRRDEEGKCPPQ